MKLPYKQYEMWKDTSTLGADSMPNTTSDKVGRQRIDDASRVGDIAEFYAVTYLWDHGYEVFPNAGCTGAIDMVAIKGDEIRLIDVKTVSETTQGGKMLTKLQKQMGVELLYFDYHTRQLSWDRLMIKGIQKERETI